VLLKDGIFGGGGGHGIVWLDNEMGELVEVVQFDLIELGNVVLVDFCNPWRAVVAVAGFCNFVDVDGIFEPKQELKMFGDDGILSVLGECQGSDLSLVFEEILPPGNGDGLQYGWELCGHVRRWR
jgi:hypothetical protein